jgi:glycerol kinase
MSISCIASIDQGTSSTRVLIISSNGAIFSSHQMEHTQHYPSAGQVEHDPLEIWKNTKICLSKAIEGVKDEHVKIVGVGITNQRETTIVWDKETGVPYHRAIVWNDTRTATICDNLIEKYDGNADYFREKTGLPIASYFSATKIMCLLDSIPGLKEDAENGKALFGTIDTWLIWKLTNGKVHVTDVTNASRTLLMNLQSLHWDDEVCKELGIPMKMLPQIKPSSCLFGHVDTSSHSSSIEEPPISNKVEISHYKRYHNVPIAGILGDQQAALFGQICFNRGDAKCTYGTGAFLLMNTGNEIVHSKSGLLTTVAYQLGGGKGGGTDSKPVYALEGSIAYSGSVIQWLRDNLEMIKSAKETEEIADSIPDNGGVYFVPAFAGLYAPYWRDDARGIITGLTAYHTKAHIVRAALEASAFQTIEIAHAMDKDSGASVPMNLLKVDGGGTANGLLMQFLSDLLGLTLVKPKIPETTALGAAFAAGLAVGLWKSLDDITQLWHRANEWKPKMPIHLRSKYVSFFRMSLFLSLTALSIRSIIGRRLSLVPCIGEIVVGLKKKVVI